MLFFKEKPVLGYCVDSGFKEDVFDFFFQATTVIVGARSNAPKEHASVGIVIRGFIADYILHWHWRVRNGT